MVCKTYQQEFQIDKSTPQGSQSFTADTISTEHYMIAKNDFFFFYEIFYFDTINRTEIPTLPPSFNQNPTHSYRDISAMFSEKKLIRTSGWRYAIP